MNNNYSYRNGQSIKKKTSNEQKGRDFRKFENRDRK